MARPIDRLFQVRCVWGLGLGAWGCGRVGALDAWGLWTRGRFGRLDAVDDWMLGATGCLGRLDAVDDWTLGATGCWERLDAWGGAGGEWRLCLSVRTCGGERFVRLARRSDRPTYRGHPLRTRRMVGSGRFLRHDLTFATPSDHGAPINLMVRFCAGTVNIVF